MDLYADPPGARTEAATRFVSCLGGSAANIAAAITRHGGAADLVTCVSDDAVGRFCRNELVRYGIGVRHVRSVGGESRTSLAVVETRIEDHQSVIYRNLAADFVMSDADVSRVDYADYGALIATGTAFAAEPSRSASFRALDLAKASGLPLILDIDHRPYSWPSAAIASEVCSRASGLCDIVIGNDDEFGFMAGAKDLGLSLARDLAHASAAIVVYKMGQFGAITITPGAEFQTGVYPVAALKPTGAGDAFLGGLVASLAKGHDLRECVLRGSASAAIVVSRVGCAPAMPTTAELEAFLSDHPGPTAA